MTGSKGVFVLRVTPGSAAHKAGLAGVEVTPQASCRATASSVLMARRRTMWQAARAADDRKVGDVVVLSVERAGKSREVRVELQPGN